MNWRDLLTTETEHTYAVTEKLMRRVNDGDLGWKPSTGSNWMTTGQLFMHLTNACGFCFRGFVTGDWGMPAEQDAADVPPEDMLPPAEKLPAAGSVSEALELLAADKRMAFDMLAQCSDEELDSKMVDAPWNPAKMPLGYQLLLMIDHLKQHKSQLYYYLKLQGQPVHTGDLWGM